MATDNFEKAVMGPILQPTEILNPPSAPFSEAFGRDDFSFTSQTLIDGKKIKYLPDEPFAAVARMREP